MIKDHSPSIMALSLQVLSCCKIEVVQLHPAHTWVCPLHDLSLLDLHSPAEFHKDVSCCSVVLMPERPPHCRPSLATKLYAETGGKHGST